LQEVQDLQKTSSGNHLLELTHAEFALSPHALIQLEQKFLAGIPFAYLLGQVEFYGHYFHLTPDVLIPRPETELMVDLLVQSRQRFQKVLDVGTGSGVILLSLLRREVAQSGVGVDISEKALAICRINADRLGLQVKLLAGDRLRPVDEKFDLIVSNPPYIKASAHRQLVHSGVDRHEPHLALYLPDAEYEQWFKEFFEAVRTRLETGGTFLMEGHELELASQAKLLSSMGFEAVEVLPDLAGCDRFLRCTLNDKSQ
jgi:release factor glutamine methyltransferase